MMSFQKPTCALCLLKVRNEYYCVAESTVIPGVSHSHTASNKCYKLCKKNNIRFWIYFLMRASTSGKVTCHMLTLPLWYIRPYSHRALTLHWQLSGSSQLMVASQITVAQAVKPMICIPKTPTSNLIRNIHSFIGILRGFAQSLQVNAWILSEIGPWSLPLKTFPINYLLSSNNSTLYCLRH